MRGWAEMLGAQAGQGGPGRAPAGSSASAGVPGLGDFLQTWQRLSQEAMRGTMAGAPPETRTVAEQMRAAQETGFRLFGQLSEAWQQMAGQVGQGASWQAAAEDFGRQMQAQVAQMAQGPTAWAGTGAKSAELWRQYLSSLERSLGPWMASMQRDPLHAAGMTPPQGNELWELGRMYWSAWDQVAEGLSASPRIGFSRETEELLIEGFDSWVDAMQAQFEYQVVLAESWSEAFQAALATLVQRAEAGEPVDSLRELSRLWATETDRVMEEALAGERYAAAQGAMVNSMMRHRKVERRIADAVLAGSHLASKSELDEAYRAIAELRRQVRSLNQRIEAMEGEPT